MEAIQVVSWFLLVICVPANVAEIFALWKYQKVRMVVVRRFISTVLYCVALILTTWLLYIFVALNAPCIAMSVIFPEISIAMTVAFEKAFLLYVMFCSSQEARDLAAGLQSSVGQHNIGFFLRHRSWFKESLFSPTKVTALVLGLLIGLTVPATMLSNPSLTPFAPVLTRECNISLMKSLRMYLGCFLCSVLFRVYVARKLARVQENYGIKKEAKLASALLIYIILPLLFFVFAPEWMQSHMSPQLFRTIVYFIISAVGCQCLVANASLRVLWLIRKEQAEPQKKLHFRKEAEKAEAAETSQGLSTSATELFEVVETGEGTKTALLTILQYSRTRFASFADFLAREFSVENLLFWQAAEDFRVAAQGNKDILELRRLADVVYDTYLDTDGPMTVNLPHECMKACKAFFTSDLLQLSSHAFTSQALALFIRAQDEIVNLILSDSFGRFLKSPEFEQFEKEVENHAQLEIASASMESPMGSKAGDNRSIRLVGKAGDSRSMSYFGGKAGDITIPPGKNANRTFSADSEDGGPSVLEIYDNGDQVQVEVDILEDSPEPLSSPLESTTHDQTQ